MLINSLKSLIKINGPITIAEFMNEALFNPTYGYYQKKIPIGKAGDFTTAPEISQVFGELIAIYFINLASHAKRPIALVEMGAGRGNLFKDLLQVIKKLAEKNIPEAQNFLRKTTFNIVEISPALQKNQQENLSEIGVQINWFSNFQDFTNSLEKNIPEREIYFIANELFDCFAINQFIKNSQGWCEKTVGINGEELGFFTEKFDPIKNGIIEKLLTNSNTRHPWHAVPRISGILNSASSEAELMRSSDAEASKDDEVVGEGAVFEHSFSAANFMQELSLALQKQGGIALIIDYGYIKNDFVNTLQALKNHQFYDCLKTPGEADITALVNFPMLENIAKNYSLNSSLISQADFFLSLGIEERRKILLENKSLQQQDEINSEIDRLIDKKQMGKLFKCLIIWK